MQLGFDPFEEVWERDVGFDRPIATAVETGNVPLVDLMLRSGRKGRPDDRRPRWATADDYRELALTRAIEAKHPAMAHFLVGQGASLKLHHFTRMIEQGSSDMAVALAQALPDGYFGTSLKATHWSSDYRTLHLAAKQNRIDVMTELIRLGLDVRARWEGKPAAHIAAAAGSIDVLRFLVETGAEIGDETLVVAAKANQLKAAEFLLARGARPNGNGWTTPLSTAVEVGHDAMAKLLLAHGADVNLPRSSPRSPIAVAIKAGNARAVRLLIDHGADLTITFDIYGGDDDRLDWVVDLVEYARHCGARGIASILKDAQGTR
jgi:ankyrin repeat protein